MVTVGERYRRSGRAWFDRDCPRDRSAGGNSLRALPERGKIRRRHVSAQVPLAATVAV